MTFPTSFPAGTPENTDLYLFADVSDGNINKKATAGQTVVAGIGSATTDLLPEGGTNKYMTNGEKTKLAGIQAGAQVNAVTSVNGQTLNVNLDLDDIPDGANFVRSNQAFDNARLSELTNATNHISNLANPHQVTKAQVGLGNLDDVQQLGREPFSFDGLTEKTDVQMHLDDLMVVQDSSPSASPLGEIKKVKNQTDLIWKGSYIQQRGQSINYYAHDFVDSTTYRFRSLVTNGNSIYYCTVSHQSSGSFAVDLGLGRWQIVGGGTATGNTVSSGSGVPTTPGLAPGDIYVDFTNGDLYYWDGSARQLFSSNGGVNFDSAPTSGSRVVFSVGTGADTIAESSLIYDPTTDTFTFDGSNISYNDTTQTYTGANTINLPDGSSITKNLDGQVINNYGSTYVENNDYAPGSAAYTTGELANFYDNYTENNFYNPLTTITHEGGAHQYTNLKQDFTGVTQNYSTITQNYVDTPTLISCEAGPLVFGNQYTYPADTQFIEAVLEYDGVSETIKFTVNSGTQTHLVNGQQVQIVAGPTDYEFIILTGTVGLWSITSSCYYNGVSTNNYENKIHNHDGDITNNTNTYETNTGTTTVYDSTSTIVNQGTQIFEGDVLFSGTIQGIPDFTGVTEFKKGVTAGMTGTTLNIVDASCLTTSIITRTAQTGPLGVIEIIPENGSFTINSSASETAVVFNYLITN